MNCPVCKTKTLTTQNLKPDLVSWKCDTCGGQWVNSFQFWKWLEESKHEKTAAAPGSPPAAGPASGETKGVRICPECGHILVKYKVGHSLDFSLDRCGFCGGIWFDKNEWEILESRNLQEEIHRVFSVSWQHQVRNEEHSRHLQEFFAGKIGEKDFAEIKRIKEWLAKHPYRRELRSFLDNDEF